MMSRSMYTILPFVAFGFAADTPVKFTGNRAGCEAEIQKSDPESEAGAKALSEAFLASSDRTPISAHNSRRRQS